MPRTMAALHLRAREEEANVLATFHPRPIPHGLFVTLTRRISSGRRDDHEDRQSQ